MRTPLPPDFLRIPVAHRALHNKAAGCIENSRSAVLAAMQAGYGIEIDIQLSSDGHAVVFHDERMERLTGHKGWLNDYTLAQLMEITLLGGIDKIMPLDDVLALVSGKVPLLIEIKEQTLVPNGTVGPLERALARAITSYQGPVAVMSFNPGSVAMMADLCPHIARGITSGAYDYEGYAPLSPALCDARREIPDYDRTGAGFISHEAADPARPRVAALKAQGAKVLCWTIRTPQQEQEARKWAHNITFEGYMPSF